MSYPHATGRAGSGPNSKQFLFLLRTILIAAVVTFAVAGRAVGEVVRIPLGTITPMNLTFTPAEGQTFSGVVVVFTDSDSVTASNFTSVSIDWGDGTSSSAGTAQQSGVDSHRFYLSGTHTFAEEGSFAPTVTFHDTLHSNNPSLSSSTAAVDDAPLCACSAVVPGAPTPFLGTGGNSSAGGAQTARQVFLSAIGGADNGATPSPQPSGFRSLNWDGVNLAGTDFGGTTVVIVLSKTVGIPVNRFQERGAMFDRVIAVSNDGFAGVNPGVTGALTAFSPPNTAAPFNRPELDLNFVLPSPHTTSPVVAGTRGFGGIFINVHNPTQASIEYFAGPQSLGRFYVPAGPPSNPAYSFLGVVFSQPIVTRVHLTLGNGTIFSFDGTTFGAGAADNTPAGTNVVALDDLAYGEPHAVAAAPKVILTPTAGTSFAGTVGTFTDTDPNGNHADFTALINWGDGHASPGQVTAAVGGGFNVSGSNTYAASGDFTITFTVEDFGGAKLVGQAEARVPPPLFLPIIEH